MFNWNQRPKRAAQTEAIPSLPNGNEIGTPSPSARIVAKLVQKGPTLSEAILHIVKEEMVSITANLSYREAPGLIEMFES
jgi:hypothetical protein